RRRHTRFSRDWSSDVCSSDLAGRRERTEIVGVLALGPAMTADPRKRLLGGRLADEDVGERLVVAQDDVERRPVPLDHVALEQQQIGRASCRERGSITGMAAYW